MSDDESRHAPPQSAGGPIFSENGSEAIENDQTGPSPTMATLMRQMQATFAAQFEQLRRDQAAKDAEHLEAVTKLAAEMRESQRAASLVTASQRNDHISRLAGLYVRLSVSSSLIHARLLAVHKRTILALLCQHYPRTSFANKGRNIVLTRQAMIYYLKMSRAWV